MIAPAMIAQRMINERMGIETALNPARKSTQRGFRKPDFTFALVTVLVFISSGSSGFTQAAPPGLANANVGIGVFGLFHPRQLTVSALEGHALIVGAADERIVLERSSSVYTAGILLSGSEIVVQSGTRTVHAPVITITGRRNDPVDFVLAVPRKIARHYRGTLEIKGSGGHLLTVVTMDRETAVASIVAAESTSETPLEALKAQGGRDPFVFSRRSWTAPRVRLL
jgi:hypothetical protein